VAKLLRDLGPKLRRGDASAPPNARVCTGIAAIDRLLGGGFPGGRLSEIAGPLSCGRTSLAHALLAQATLNGGVAAVVDAADAFDPSSAEAGGVDLGRVLWVRAPRLRSALRSAEQLLAVRGFALVLLDLALPDLRMAPATGLRLARLAAGTGIPLIALSLQRCLGTAAEIAVELRSTRANFGGSPVLLENLEIEVALVRHRSAPAPGGRTISVRLHPTRAA
jgi:hypothetical protein